MLSIKQLDLTRINGNTSYHVQLPSLELDAGNIVVIEGNSGTGKSTLLEMIGLILKPTNVETFLFNPNKNQYDIAKLINQDKQNKLAHIRSEHLGFMLQTGGLLPFLTVRQNLLLPLQLLQKSIDKERLAYLVEKLNITNRINYYPKQLSVGERQRASFIRAIMHKPALLLADEPTSALDPYNANVLFDLIIAQAKEDNIAAIIITHDVQKIAERRFVTLSPQFLSPYECQFLPAITKGTS